MRRAGFVWTRSTVAARPERRRMDRRDGVFECAPEVVDGTHWRRNIHRSGEAKPDVGTKKKFA
jgi:hypothetical protein